LNSVVDDEFRASGGAGPVSKKLNGQRMGETGVGKPLNAWSAGVYSATEDTLTPGLPVELSINRVIWSNGNGAAISIDSHDHASRDFQQAIIGLLWNTAPSPETLQNTRLAPNRSF
jgi:hypothetical protein